MDNDGRPVVTLTVVVIRADGRRETLPADQVHVQTKEPR